MNHMRFFAFFDFWSKWFSCEKVYDIFTAPPIDVPGSHGTRACSLSHPDQGWEFALSLKITHFKKWPWVICSHRYITKEQPWVICSCCSLQKSSCERFSHVTLYKRAMWVHRSHCSLKKSNVSDSLVIWLDCSPKTSNFLIKYFLFAFESFPFFYAQEKIAPLAYCSFALF